MLLITILGFIPYEIWIAYTDFKRRWKRVGIQIGIPVVVYSILLGASALITPMIQADNLNDRYDCEVSLGEPIYEYDSERSFNGDGYSFSVYPLPSTVRKRFESAD